MEQITKILQILGKLPPLWRGISISLALIVCGIVLFFLSGCGTSKSTINNYGNDNTTSVEINSKPATSVDTSIDSTYVLPITR